MNYFCMKDANKDFSFPNNIFVKRFHLTKLIIHYSFSWISKCFHSFYEDFHITSAFQVMKF